MIDVVCYGSILPDRILTLPHFPQSGDSMHALSEQVYLGGEPCNVGGHLARWGVPIAIAGSNLGDDIGADVVEQALAQRHNTLAFTRRDRSLYTPTCYILCTPDGERTIIASWAPNLSYTLPPTDIVQQARLVSVSIYGPGMDAMIDLAHAERKPLALSDPSGADEQRLKDAVIITTSHDALERRHQIRNVRGWIEHVWERTHAFIVVSDGAGQVLARTPDGSELEQQPRSIEPTDTTGAGDALKAGIIYGWLHNWPAEHTLTVAIEAAAQCCLCAGPCPDIPLIYA